MQKRQFTDQDQKLADTIVSCEACPRLREYCRRIGEVKRKAYLDWDYWARPVPSFGPLAAKLLVVGLAPGAHGANRTGRIFTGDRSGDALYGALYRGGWTSQPEASSKDDGLVLYDCRVTNIVHCAPPNNTPSTEEKRTCQQHFVAELQAMKYLETIVTLGALATTMTLQTLAGEGFMVPRPRPKFQHGTIVKIVREGSESGVSLLMCYHPSQQNLFTGRLTQAMLDQVFADAAGLSPVST